MVAKITVPLTIKRALNYNEQKVEKGMAECIYAKGFLKDAEELKFYEKIHHFERFISLNKRAEANTVHISLNFTKNEKMDRKNSLKSHPFTWKKLGSAVSLIWSISTWMSAIRMFIL